MRSAKSDNLIQKADSMTVTGTICKYTHTHTRARTRTRARARARKRR
jgi:hypothetical protein